MPRIINLKPNLPTEAEPLSHELKYNIYPFPMADIIQPNVKYDTLTIKEIKDLDVDSDTVPPVLAASIFYPIWSLSGSRFMAKTYVDYYANSNKIEKGKLSSRPLLTFDYKRRSQFHNYSHSRAIAPHAPICSDWDQCELCRDEMYLVESSLINKLRQRALKIYKPSDTTHKVLISRYHYQLVEKLLSSYEDDFAELICNSKNFGPYFFHDRFKQFLFEYMLNPEQARKWRSQDMFIFSAYTELFSEGRNFNLLPISWEQYPIFESNLKLYFQSRFGTTIPLVQSPSVWPTQLKEAFSQLSSNPACEGVTGITECQKSIAPYKTYASDNDFFDISTFVNKVYSHISKGQKVSLFSAESKFFCDEIRHILFHHLNRPSHTKNSIIPPALSRSLNTLTEPNLQLNSIRKRHRAEVKSLTDIYSTSIGFDLSRLDCSPLFELKTKEELMKFISNVWDKYLRKIYVFMYAHSRRIKPQMFLAIWLYSVITCGIKADPKDSNNQKYVKIGKKVKGVSERYKYLPVLTQSQLKLTYPSLYEAFTMIYELSVEPTTFTLKQIVRGKIGHYSLIMQDLFEEHYGWDWNTTVEPQHQRDEFLNWYSSQIKRRLGRTVKEDSGLDQEIMQEYKKAYKKIKDKKNPRDVLHPEDETARRTVEFYIDMINSSGYGIDNKGQVVKTPMMDAEEYAKYGATNSNVQEGMKDYIRRFSS